ncbi:MAG: bifunctional isocitrate dehydrogenase kinase/phosphatase [Acidimicrobiales bacterium]|nr:bifunctional isocitrate dehydrogenase kinase/phosphatase [Actinomycetes bacterium]MDP6288329.1 bifunctional isocitrate dehydrogenase kinase/phosphatase [Acidimicrobiales bacterium]MDP6910770.1 bifunctional isocitrate dehydrogenase kinase/phosphatase [Acidimicrobiales bacterium]
MSDHQNSERDDDRIGHQIADTILAGFVDYIAGFRKVSRRAGAHFTDRNWSAGGDDADRRLLMHRATVVTTVDRVRPLVDGVADRRGIWRSGRSHYKERIADRSDFGLAETFFNSVTRRIFTTIGVDNDVELRWFGATTISRGEGRAELFTTATRVRDTAAMVREILEAAAFDAPWADIDGDSRRVAARIDSFLLDEWDSLLADGIDMLRPVFYRNKGAYLVGRLRQLNRVTPIVIPVVHGDDGLRVDTVLVTESHASRLFSFTRSHFFVEWPNPSELVGFLKSLLPMKSLAELYTAIGFPQHGKTSLYRSLYRHLDHSHDKFVRTRGTPGMVMAVFTLVSFNVVFKIIKDRFDPPKNTTRDAVKRRYDLVYNHDRVGRMVEAWEFENLSFEKDRFDPDLLEELLATAAESVRVVGDQVVIRHVYSERQVYPLNLYLREMSTDKAVAAAIDWGWSIKDLAVANVFPGDLFTKNFGVTRHGNVVFYDYDELVLLEECRFRAIPQTDDPADEMRSQPWFSVEPGDVFPEQFPTFMAFPSDVSSEVRKRFDEVHADLYTVAFWKDVQSRLARRDLPEFYPYSERLRFRRKPVEAADSRAVDSVTPG